uniref:Uncharacterized protein n=1 Tax=Anguilla anguilla TaxID=7936 RepID=A0A0E9Q4W7_ANGAN
MQPHSPQAEGDKLFHCTSESTRKRDTAIQVCIEILRIAEF